jgi:hypothetical protein
MLTVLLIKKKGQVRQADWKSLLGEAGGHIVMKEQIKMNVCGIRI